MTDAYNVLVKLQNDMQSCKRLSELKQLITTAVMREDKRIDAELEKMAKEYAE